MNHLKGLFDDIADQAKSYQVGERAWAAARRRRYAVRTAPVAVAAAVAVAFGAGVPFFGGDGGTPASGLTTPTVPADQRVERGGLDWLPTEVRYPPTPPPVLPRGRSVGAGALVLLRGNGDKQEHILVTASGQMYQVPIADPPFGYVALSPDGRWLASQLYDRDKLVLRDLTGTTEHVIADALLWAVDAWSSDGRYAVVGAGSERRETKDAPPIRVDLTTGEQRPVRISADGHWFPVVMLPSGEVLLLTRPQSKPDNDGQAGNPSRAERFLWRGVDPATGGERSGEITLSGALYPDEQVHAEATATASPGGATLAMSVSSPAYRNGGSVMVALITVDLATGMPMSRYELPTAGDVGSPSPGGAGGHWALNAYRNEGIVLARRNSSGTNEIQLLDPGSGERTVVCSIPAGTDWLLRGER